MRRKDHYLHKTWLHLRERCNNPKHKDYKNYGGRGITVCPEWDDFWQFVEDMGERPEGCSIDRINNDGGYSKDNCRWATRLQQAANKRPYPKLRKVKRNVKGYDTSVSPNTTTYHAKIRLGGEPIFIGSYSCPLLANLQFRKVHEAFFPNTKLIYE